jgi:transposase
MNHFDGLTDEQWKEVEPLFPKPEKRGRGKPHTPWRKVLNTILYFHLSNTKWCQLPKGPQWASKSAAHRWYKTWLESGFWKLLLNRTTPFFMEEAVSTAARPIPQYAM